MIKKLFWAGSAFLLVAVSASAQTPAGGEFRVNTYTAQDQDDAAVGMGPDGRFVIAWESPNIDGSNDAVMRQRYAADGAPQGANFQVNTYTDNNQDDVAVAVARDGSFVVVWDSFGQEGPLGYSGVFGQRYDASGNPLGSEFRVNTYTTDDQGLPSVAIAPNKSFVVVWASRNQVPGGEVETFAQRFDAAGVPIGGEFQVNTYTAGYQQPVRTGPGVAIDASGNFVVVWTSYDPVGGQDGSFAAVFGQRFSSSGTRLGGEFQVNTYTTNNQVYPTVAMASSGDFVVVWESPQDGSTYGVFGQRFNASGSPLGAEFQVNTYTTSYQDVATVTADLQGNFVVVWGSNNQDGSGGAIMARRFASNGSARGTEFRVNTYTTNSQQGASIAADGVGNFTVAWESFPQDGSGRGVFAQRFGGLFPAALDVNVAGNRVWEPGETVVVAPSWRNLNGAPQTFAGTLTGLTGPAGATYTLNDGAGNYGTVANNTSAPCTDCYSVSVDNPTRPVQHWDATALESITPDTQGQQKKWSLHLGGSFTDVPASSPFYRFIETLLHKGITGGCGGTNYCPSTVTTRDQMSVFVLVAKEGAGYTPVACGTPVFTDVPASNPFCRFIEELARRGVVGGCGGNNYCPTSPVTRDAMSVFALRTLDPTLNPPVCVAGSEMFLDVPSTNGFCRWIEELARRGVVSGCGNGNYCPASAVTREQMGVFISATFGLTLYGP
jgi:hypothetical protein